MTEAKPKWSRRKADRPAEILEAALELFVQRGFEAAKLSDVAVQAGIAKGTIYRYFDTKEDLFRAVVRQALSANLSAFEQAASLQGSSVRDLIPLLLEQAAGRVEAARVPAILRMILAESRAFPDLAAIWHDEVISRVLSLLVGAIAAGQARGEIRPGDPALYAFSILGPLVTGVLFREVFAQGSRAPDLAALARQHSETVLRGMLTTP